MAFTLKINGTPHEVDVDGDTPPVCRLVAHRDLASKNHVRNAAESGQTRTDANDPKATWRLSRPNINNQGSASDRRYCKRSRRPAARQLRE